MTGDGVVTIINCKQLGDYSRVTTQLINCVVTVLPVLVNSNYMVTVVTVPSRYNRPDKIGVMLCILNLDGVFSKFLYLMGFHLCQNLQQGLVFSRKFKGEICCDCHHVITNGGETVYLQIFS